MQHTGIPSKALNCFEKSVGAFIIIACVLSFAPARPASSQTSTAQGATAPGESELTRLVNPFVGADNDALFASTVDYEQLGFVLDPEEALKPGAPQIWPEGNLALNNRNEAQPTGQRRGNPDQGLNPTILSMVTRIELTTPRLNL